MLTRKKAAAAASHHQPPVVQISQYRPRIKTSDKATASTFRFKYRHNQRQNDCVLRWN